MPDIGMRFSKRRLSSTDRVIQRDCTIFANDCFFLVLLLSRDSGLANNFLRAVTCILFVKFLLELFRLPNVVFVRVGSDSDIVK